MAREIVYYDEMHTMMYQVVTVKINEKFLNEMLAEDISEESKRELIQAYYVCQLDKGIEIKGKHNYGAWNASISDIKNIYQYEPNILEKITGNVAKEEVEKQMNFINENILGLSESENIDSLRVQKDILKSLGLVAPTKKM